MIGRKKYIPIVIVPAVLLAGLLVLKSSPVIFLGKKYILRQEESVGPNMSEKKKIETSLMFFGDFMFDRYVRTISEKKGPDYIIEKTEKLFNSQDLTVANLEGPITNNKSKSEGTQIGEKNHLIFTFDERNAIKFLKNCNINLVNIGNNHVLNFGSSGLEKTITTLKFNGIDYFGSPLDDNNYFAKEINGRKIAFVNYNQFSKINSETTVNLLKSLRKNNDFIVVYTHWGSEYQLKENNSQIEKAHRFIDAGADLVIGSHPHVVQPLEIYKDKIIFYSLGNFVFDQYFSEDTRTMLAAGVLLSDKNLEITLTPLYQEKNGQIVLADEKKKQALLSRLANDSQVDYNMKQSISKGLITINE